MQRVEVDSPRSSSPIIGCNGRNLLDVSVVTKVHRLKAHSRGRFDARSRCSIWSSSDITRLPLQICARWVQYMFSDGSYPCAWTTSSTARLTLPLRLGSCAICTAGLPSEQRSFLERCLLTLTMPTIPQSPSTRHPCRSVSSAA